MRDILLTLVFAGLLPMALRYTWVGVLLYTWVSVMNPHRLTYGFAQDMPWAAIAAGATLISMLWNSRDLRLRADPMVVPLVLFMLWMCITTYFAFHVSHSFEELSQALKIQLMTLVAIAAIRERKHIEMFLWVNVVSIGIYGVKGGVFTIASGGSTRVWGPSGGFIEGNNEIGLALVMTIPLMNYLRLVAANRWVRRGLLAMMLLSAVAALGTQSRGAFVAICAMGLVLFTRSNRKMLSAVGTTLVAVLLLAFMPTTWEERMRTIEGYKDDTSAQGRINAWLTAINVANDRITGAGFSMEWPDVFLRYAPNPNTIFTAHSIFFQVIGEHGWIGFLLFTSMGLFGFITAAKLRKQAHCHPDAEWLHTLAGMIQVSMVGYAVGGAFLSLSYFDLPYNVLVLLVASKYWLAEERWKTEKIGVLGAARPMGTLPDPPRLAKAAAR